MLAGMHRREFLIMIRCIHRNEIGSLLALAVDDGNQLAFTNQTSAAVPGGYGERE